MSHDRAVRELAASRDVPEWVRLIALRALRDDPLEAARIFRRLAKLFEERAEEVRIEYLEDAGRLGLPGYHVRTL